MIIFTNFAVTLLHLELKCEVGIKHVHMVCGSSFILISRLVSVVTEGWSNNSDSSVDEIYLGPGLEVLLLNTDTWCPFCSVFKGSHGKICKC